LSEGYTETPNDLLDYWLEVLKPSELVLYLFIRRRVKNTTAGRKAGGYWISLGQFSAVRSEKDWANTLKGGTGLARKTVQKGLKMLIKWGLITRTGGRGKRAGFYGIPTLQPPPSCRKNHLGTGVENSPLGEGQNLSLKSAKNSPLPAHSGIDFTPTETTPVESTIETTTSVGGEIIISSSRTSDRFPEWWGVWSPVMGTNHRPAALAVWTSVVTVELEQGCFACTHSYLASRGDRNGGYNPENFLRDQARDDFEGRFIPWKEAFNKNQTVRNQTNIGAKMLRGKRR
jgi:hypothetical protein